MRLQPMSFVQGKMETKDIGLSSIKPTCLHTFTNSWFQLFTPEWLPDLKQQQHTILLVMSIEDAFIFFW